MLPHLTPENYHPQKLRDLALWYREQAERTENPTIWDGRLRTADEFEAAAAQLENSRKLRLVASPPARDARSDARLHNMDRPAPTPLAPAA